MLNRTALRSLASSDQLIAGIENGDRASFLAARAMLIRLAKKRATAVRLLLGLRILAEIAANQKEEDDVPPDV